MKSENKKMSDYIDEYGAVCHKYPMVPLTGEVVWERGDAARETGTYFTVRPWSTRKFILVVKKAFLKEDGSLCRHLFANVEWHRDPKEFSRDQWTGLACAAVIRPCVKKILLKEQLKHPFTAQNGDLITWEWNLYIRMFKAWYLWPLLFILDFGLVVNSIIRVIKNKCDSDNVGDDINQTTMLYVATQKLPTPMSWLARLIYKTFHPGVQKAWDWYYRHPENPPMAEVWRPVIKRWFEPKNVKN